METVRQKIFRGHDPYANFNTIGLDMQGWNSQVPAFEEVITEVRPSLIVEVGSWKGASAIHMARTCKRLGLNTHILCIDTFLGSVEHWSKEDPNLPESRFLYGRPEIYKQFMSNVVLCGLSDSITAVPIDSINGAHLLKVYGILADIVYIDAGHDYDSVKADLRLYKDIVRPGGILLGDDWFHPPIKAAVADTLGEVVTRSWDKFSWKRPEV